MQAAEAALSADEVTTREGETFYRPEALTVQRGRTSPVLPKHCPIAIPYAGPETAQRVGGRRGPLNEHDMDLVIEVYVVGEPVDDALDPYIVWIIQALGADETLGGAANGVQLLSIERASAFAEVPLAAAELTFGVSFHSRAGDPTRRN